MKRLLAFVLLLFSVTPSHAAFCGKYDEFAKALERKYEEVSIAKGVSGGGTVMVELFASKKGTFTILVIEPSGMTCIVATGDGWLNSEKTTPGTKS